MTLIAGLRPLLAKARCFASDARASVSVDFVVSIPILLAVLVFTTEYGRVLQMRTVLDNAVADATRYLARAPLNELENGFPPSVIAVAEGLITSRVNTDLVAIGAPDIEDQTVQTSSSDFRTVSLSAAVGVSTPALSILALAGPEATITNSSGEEISLSDIEGFVLISSDTARYFGR
ncbi:MAG: TadE/TadG family type IV pilus assembly protein [Pikeienuella sp.]